MLNTRKCRRHILVAIMSIALVFTMMPLIPGGVQTASAEDTYTLDGAVATLKTTNLQNLQLALADDSVNEIVIGSTITLPDGTELDGDGKIIRVPVTYVDEDGTVNGTASNFGVFAVNAGANVILSNLTIIGGNAGSNSGAIKNQGTLQLNGVSIIRSSRGIYQQNGNAVLKNCNISGNVSSEPGAGIRTYANYIGGRLVMDGCTINDNCSRKYASAIYVDGINTPTYMNNTVIADNIVSNASSTWCSGAVVLDGYAFIMNSAVTGNVSDAVPGDRVVAAGIEGLEGKLFAVNSIFTDNYLDVRNEPVRRDVWDSSNEGRSLYLYHCITGNIQTSLIRESEMPGGLEGYRPGKDNGCRNDSNYRVAELYTSDSIDIPGNGVSKSFLRPLLDKTTSLNGRYFNVKEHGLAGAGGLDTYFDYSDPTNIKMGFSDDNNIVGLSQMDVKGIFQKYTAAAADAAHKVDTYIQGDTRADGVIGPSGAAVQCTVSASVNNRDAGSIKITMPDPMGTGLIESTEDQYGNQVLYDVPVGTEVTLTAVTNSTEPGKYGFYRWQRLGTTEAEAEEYKYKVTSAGATYAFQAEWNKLTKDKYDLNISVNGGHGKFYYEYSNASDGDVSTVNNPVASASLSVDESTRVKIYLLPDSGYVISPDVSIIENNAYMVPALTTENRGYYSTDVDRAKSIQITYFQKSSPILVTLELSAISYTYNGSVKTPAVTVKDADGKTLVKNTDYEVSYADGRKAIGSYEVTVNGIGEYTGTITETFRINPTKVSIVKPKVGKRYVNVKWKKAPGSVKYKIAYKQKGASEYRYAYSTSTSKNIKKLKSKKYYYVKVQAYKKVGEGTYYGAWSSTKKVKIK